MESFLGVEHQRSSPRLWIASCGMQLFPSGRPHKARPGGGMWTGWLALPVIHQGSLQDWIESFHSLLSLVLFPYVLVHFESSIMQHFLLFHFLKKKQTKKQSWTAALKMNYLHFKGSWVSLSEQSSKCHTNISPILSQRRFTAYIHFTKYNIVAEEQTHLLRWVLHMNLQDTREKRTHVPMYDWQCEFCHVLNVRLVSLKVNTNENKKKECKLCGV